jgi:Nitroreductase family
MTHGKRLAGILTDEPRPRENPLAWAPFIVRTSGIERLARPKVPARRDFEDVLAARRSSIGQPIEWSNVSELLWYAIGYKGYAEAGRAGLPIAWSASPTSGGLQAVQIVCISDDGSAPRLYDAKRHEFAILEANPKSATSENAAAVRAVTGTHRGCTLRLIGDRSKLFAAYENADSLLYRDAGCIVATLCLCAEWLKLSACPLGFLGQSMLPLLGFPQDQFCAVGAVQITKSSTA